MLPRNHVATRVGELDVRDGGDDFREEGSVGRVLGLFEHLRVRVTERRLAHITQPDCSLCRGFKLVRGTDCVFPLLFITHCNQSQLLYYGILISYTYYYP